MALSIATPSLLGTTSLPKKTLSYRWTICDATAILKYLNTPESPEFCMALTPNVNWCLRIKNGSPSGYFSVFLVGKTTARGYTDVVISDCTFSLLRLTSNGCYEVKHSATAPETQKRLNQNCEVTVNVKLEDLNCYLDRDILTIQVDATILCMNGRSVTFHLPADSIREDIQELYEEGLFTDVTIKCEGEEFKVHKAILAAQSPVFKKMFQVDMKEKISGVVEMTDTTPAVMSDLVTYLYTGSAPNLRTLTRGLLHVANKINMSYSDSS